MQYIKLLITTILIFTISSCSGQKRKNDVPITTPKSEVENNQKNDVVFDNPMFTSGSNMQIDQVVRTVFQDSKGSFWFGTESGLYKLVDNSLVFIDQIKSETGKGVTIKDITQSKDGNIWIGHTDGISSINGNTVTNYYKSNGLISNDVWCITADSNGTIWIGTIEGVCTFNGKEFSKFPLPEGKKDTTKGISSTKMVHNIKEDSKGTLWFSTNAGLFSYANNVLTNVSEKTGIQTNFVNEVFEDSKGKLWISTKKGLYNLTEDKAINITEGKIENGKGIGSIAEDKDGSLWFVSNQHYLYTYKNGKLTEYKKTANNKGPVVFKIYKDQDNRLWFVGFGGAYRLNNNLFLNVRTNGPW